MDYQNGHVLMFGTIFITVMLLGIGFQFIIYLMKDHGELVGSLAPRQSADVIEYMAELEASRLERERIAGEQGRIASMVREAAKETANDLFKGGKLPTVQALQKVDTTYWGHFGLELVPPTTIDQRLVWIVASPFQNDTVENSEPTPETQPPSEGIALTIDGELLHFSTEADPRREHTGAALVLGDFLTDEELAPSHLVPDESFPDQGLVVIDPANFTPPPPKPLDALVSQWRDTLGLVPA